MRTLYNSTQFGGLHWAFIYLFLIYAYFKTDDSNTQVATVKVFNIV